MLQGRGQMNFNGDYIDDYLSSTIPLYSVMGFHVDSYNGNSLTMAAPMAPNINDKGTGFAGSIYSLSVLSGWAFVSLGLRNGDLKNQVVVQKSEIKYLKPITGDFVAVCNIDEGDSMDAFLDEVKRNNKGRIRIVVEVKVGDTLCAEFSGTYFAIP